MSLTARWSPQVAELGRGGCEALARNHAGGRCFDRHTCTLGKVIHFFTGLPTFASTDATAAVSLSVRFS
jgi:hypothetical protein